GLWRGLRLWLGLGLGLGLGLWFRRRRFGRLFWLRRRRLAGLSAGCLPGDLRRRHAPDRRLVPAQRLAALDAEVGVVGVLVAVRTELHAWGSPNAAAGRRQGEAVRDGRGEGRGGCRRIGAESSERTPGQ